MFTPDLISWGIPTPGDRILFDISAMITIPSIARRMTIEGGRHDRDWRMAPVGRPCDDRPLQVPGGTLPTGGLDHGRRAMAWR